MTLIAGNCWFQETKLDVTGEELAETEEMLGSISKVLVKVRGVRHASTGFYLRVPAAPENSQQGQLNALPVSSKCPKSSVDAPCEDFLSWTVKMPSGLRPAIWQQAVLSRATLKINMSPHVRLTP